LIMYIQQIIHIFARIATWVQRPGSSRHLFKSYHFLDVDKTFGRQSELTIDLYLKDSIQLNPQGQNVKNDVTH